MSDLDFGSTVRGYTSGQKVFGRYVLQKLLGRGGMGVVWLARDGKLEREVALKFLPEIVVSDPRSIDELKREARRNLDLTHPHIVRIYDFVDDATGAAIAMEYVDGTTLSKLALDQNDRTFPPAQLAPWLRQVCAALDYAHASARVVHRDLKPANLMLNSRGEVKLADFGIARSIADSVTRASAQAGTSGTPVYMSPQQMMGDDPAVTDDVYSLGATLYEMLTSKPPFHSGNLLIQAQSKVPPPVNERRAANGIAGDPVPATWEKTIAACLAKDPKDRPQSAGEVAEGLGLIPKDPKRPKPEGKVERGVSTRPDSVQRPGSTTKTPLYAGLAISVLLLAGLGYYFGVYAPGQSRLAAEKVRQTQEQARIAEAARVEEQKKSAADAAERKRQEEIATRLAAARGGLVIRTEPAGAEVRVGSVALDKSPLSVKDLKLGKYPVRVRLAGYEDYDGEIEVKENEFADSGLIRLVRSTGSVHLTSVPSGVEYHFTPLPRETDESDRASRPEGRTPVESMKIPTGKYEVLFDRPGWGSSKQTVTVNRGGEEKISADLRGGSIEVQTEPAGATVRLQGKVAGTTPLVLSDVPWRSPAQVTVELPAYAPVTRELTPQTGQTIPLHLQLQRLPFRVKLVELPTGLSAPVKARWAGRDIPIASDGTIELPVTGGTGRLSVSYGPTVWEKDLTLVAGETTEVKPDLVLRFDISHAPRVTRLKADSVMTGGLNSSSSETQEITWKRQENGQWVECETRIIATKNSYKLLSDELYEPNTRYRFERTRSGWNVEIVSGGMKMKALKNFKPPAPASAAVWLNQSSGILPKTPVLPGDSWEVSVADYHSAGMVGINPGSGHVRGRLVSLEMESGNQVAVFSYEVDLSTNILDGIQTIRGTAEIRAVLGKGWVPEYKIHYAINTPGMKATAISDSTVTEEPVQ